VDISTLVDVSLEAIVIIIKAGEGGFDALVD